MRLHPHLTLLPALFLLAVAAPDPARAAKCGGLNQQACKASEGPRACTGRLTSVDGRCRIRKTVPRNSQPPKVVPHVQIEEPPPIRPQLCNPGALTTKGGRC